MPIWQERDTLAMIEEFPCAADRQRVKRLQELRDLWQDGHERLFTDVSTSGLNSQERKALLKKWAGLDYTECNLLRMLSRDNADSLSLEPSTLTADDDAKQQIVDAIRDASDWDSILVDQVEQCSALGEMCFKVYEHPQYHDTRLDFVDPDYVFRGEDYFDEYRALNADPRVTVAPFIATPVRAGDKRYVLLEIHEQGAVVYRAYEWKLAHAKSVASEWTFADKGQLLREVDPADLIPWLGALGGRYYETGVDDPTLVIVRNAPDIKYRSRGVSDYSKDLIDLQKQFEEKLSLLLRHFQELINSGIAVLPTEARALVVKRGVANARKASDFGRNAGDDQTLPTIEASELNAIFEDGANKGITRHVQRAAQYDGGMKSLQLVMSAFERCAQITLDPLLEQAQAPESGRAMRLARTRDRKRIKRKHARYSRQLAHLFEIAARFAGADVDRVRYEFPDPFPISEEEAAEIAERRCGGPTMTVEAALVRYFGLSVEEAAEEAAALKQGQHQAGMSAGVGLFQNVPAATATPDEFGIEEDENE
jgi:hypothetical protein